MSLIIVTVVIAVKCNCINNDDDVENIRTRFCLTGPFFWSYSRLGWYSKVNFWNCGSSFYRLHQQIPFLSSEH